MAQILTARPRCASLHSIFVKKRTCILHEGMGARIALVAGRGQADAAPERTSS